MQPCPTFTSAMRLVVIVILILKAGGGLGLVPTAQSADKSKDSEKVAEGNATPSWPTTASDDGVTILMFENVGSHTEFPSSLPEESFRFSAPLMAVHRLPLKYLPGGARALWSGPVQLQAFTRCELPDGKIELLIRSPGRSRLWIDGQIVATTPPKKLFGNAHAPFEVYQPDIPWLRVPFVGDHEIRVPLECAPGKHEIVLESLVGSKTSRCEVGETLVAVRYHDRMFTVVGPQEPSTALSHSLSTEQITAPTDTSGRSESFRGAFGTTSVNLVDREFEAYRSRLDVMLDGIDRQSLIATSSIEDDFWKQRHELARNAVAKLTPLQVPEPISGLDENNLVDRFIHSKLDALLTASAQHQVGDQGLADWDHLASVEQLVDGLTFLRRATLDTTGVPPTPDEISAFVSAGDSVKTRRDVINKLLASERWADHWVSYWQDVLAENPNVLKPKLNNTGPFRLWLHDSLLLNKPMDRFVTELIRMEGDALAGAAAGFGWATENDVPMAEKAHVVAGAFLAVDLKCARCHDAPYHPWTQRDLFSIGAMLNDSEIKVPKTSSVPKEFFELKGNDSPIVVTLFPNEIVEPQFPASIRTEVGIQNLLLDARLLGGRESARERLAAMVTCGENRRFAETIVNRLWTRMMGWGLMGGTDDWLDEESANAELLNYLGRELTRSGYDLKHVAKLILESRTYQRKALDEFQVSDRRLANYAPWLRRMTAEQVVDSLHTATGISMATEPVTFDPEASQKLENFLNLGVADRAWKLASLSNERDRPSLSLPRAAMLVNCLEAFGWRQSRQAPLTHREMEANIVQPGVIANSELTGMLTRLTDQAPITHDALNAETCEQFVHSLFLRVLTREPSEEEKAIFVKQLSEGFEDREQTPARTEPTPPTHRGFVTWTNHFSVEANKLMRDVTIEVAQGPEPTQRLRGDWRERAEDAVWALVNAPEFQIVR